MRTPADRKSIHKIAVVHGIVINDMLLDPSVVLIVKNAE